MERTRFMCLSMRARHRALLRFLLLGFVVAAVLLSNASAGQPEVSNAHETVKVLTIGNSFAEDALTFLPLFAEAGGKQLLVWRANLGGASLQRHVRHLTAFEGDPESEAGRPYVRKNPATGTEEAFSLREALEAVEWDYVTIQQFSNLSYQEDRYQPAAGILIDYIRNCVPEAEILVHQTWAYREDFPGYAADDFSMEIMHAGVVAAYQKLADEHGLRTIPVGEAFYHARQTARWSFRLDPDFDFENPPEDQLPNQDGSLNTGWRWLGSKGKRRLVLDFKHANVAGKYLAGAVWYEMLFGDPTPENAPVPEDLRMEAAADLRRIAHKTVQGRYATDLLK